MAIAAVWEPWGAPVGLQVCPVMCLVMSLMMSFPRNLGSQLLVLMVMDAVLLLVVAWFVNYLLRSQKSRRSC